MDDTRLTSRPPLPSHWVARIFRELQGYYGSRFLDMWRVGQLLPDGQDAGIANAKQVWGEKLAGFADQPDRIKRALDSLPQHPPTLPEFVALCRQSIAENLQALPPPVPDALQRLANIERAAGVKVDSAGGKAWAYKLREQYMRGERLQAIQVQIAAAALEEAWTDGKCERAAA